MKFAGVSLAALAAMLAASQAQAAADQSSSSQVEEVVVTGSSIRGVAAVGSPVVALSREEIKDTGLTTARDIARALPQVINLGADEAPNNGAQDSGANTTKVSGINIRGLGTGATLVLVNGRRVAPAGLIREVTDPDNIASSAVQRFEVVTDGASAIYGSDAVAGVVNIITRKGYDGAETTLRYGGADGLDQEVFSQVFGKTWGTGSAMIAYEYQRRSAMNGDARKFFSADLRPYGGNDQRSTQAIPGNIVVGSGATAVRYALPGGSGVGINPASLVAGTPNRFEDGRFSDYLPRQKRNSFFGNIYQDITPNWQVFYEGFESGRSFTQRSAPAGAQVTVPRTNPYFFSPVPGATTVSVEFRYLTPTGDEARFYGYEKNFQHAVGSRLKLPGDWQLNNYLTLSVNRAMQHRAGLTNPTQLALALADTNPATALNPFASTPGATNPATLNRILGWRDSYSQQIWRDGGLKLDGPLFSLPAGQVRMALGGEYQSNIFKYSVFSTIITPDNSPKKQKDIRQTRKIAAAYGELFVPIVGPANAMPGVQRLELSAAVRYEDYSDFGSTTNPKLALIWQPVSSLTLQSTYGTSFRAPTLIDKSEASASIFLGNIADPTSPTGTTRGITNQLNNPNLTPETATTWTAGATWRPEAGPLRGFSTSLNYYKISYKNLIDVVRGHLSNESLYSAYIIRNPTLAQVQAFLDSPYLESGLEPASNFKVIIDARRNNLGAMNQDGIDYDADYRFNAMHSIWRVGVQVTKILGQKRQVSAGLPFTDVVDRLGFPVDLRVRGSMGVNHGPWSANAFVNYVDSYLNTAITPNVQVKAWTTVDATLSYRVEKGRGGALDGVRISLNAQNLFDRDPPVVINGSSSFDGSNASVNGRFVSLELTKAW